MTAFHGINYLYDHVAYASFQGAQVTDGVVLNKYTLMLQEIR